MAGTQEYGLGEFTFPRGWFMVAQSAHVQDKPLPVRFFGREFVVYRGQSGKPYVVDAYCPHMGAHLARNSSSYVIHDGQIEGDSIRCPFHGWRFGPDGQCDDIPYAKGPIPKAACIKTWPVEERLGAVFVWFDEEGGAPEWDAPDLAEWHDSSWVQWQYDEIGVVKSHPVEIIDNIADVAHFVPVHGSTTVEFFENEFVGHKAIQRFGGGHRTLAADGQVLDTDTAYHGPGVLISRMAGTHGSIIFITHTPIDDGVVMVWHGLMVRAPSGAAVATAEDVAAARQYQEYSRLAFMQDFDIWANKRPNIQGMHIMGDGPFRKARIWYRQFYNPRARKEEYLRQLEGLIVPQGFRSKQDWLASLADAA